MSEASLSATRPRPARARSTSSATRRPTARSGYIWNGVPTLLLTTTGRSSGEPRTTP